MGKKSIKENTPEEVLDVESNKTEEAPKLKKFRGTVNVARLNVRAAASFESDITKEVTKDTVLNLSELADTSEWYAVAGGGYVCAKFINR